MSRDDALRLIVEAVGVALRAPGSGWEAERPLVVAVSGGADSAALLLGAAALPDDIRPPLIAAHFQHGLRKRAQAPERRKVEALAAQAGAAFEAGIGDTRAHAEASGLSLEAAARELRYRFLAEVAARHDAFGVGVAHTRDDQAETVLLRLARGAGLRGASAMEQISTRRIEGRSLRLLRPLLDLSRSDTERACAAAGYAPIADPTNRTVGNARGRLRLEVLPGLSAINPRAIAALASFAQKAAEDDALLERLSADAVRGTERRSPGRVSWDTAVLAGLAPPLFARVLQAAWRYLTAEGAALSARQLASAKALLAEGGSIDLRRGARFVVEQRRCAIETNTPEGESLPAEPVLLAVPGSVRAGRWVLDSSIVRRAGAPESRWQVTVDGERLTGPLLVRRRAGGDRMQPSGLDTPVRMQDILVNAKVPRRLRDALPVVESREGIAWLCGVRVAEWARVRASTKRIITLTARRVDWPNYGRPEPGSADDW